MMADEENEGMAKLSERLKELMPSEDHILKRDTQLTFTYSWIEGYEHFAVSSNERGDESYSGAFHPNGVCEGEEFCWHCGRVIPEATTVDRRVS
jgi:hypothetical protein